MNKIVKFDSSILSNKNLIKKKVEYGRKIAKQEKPRAQWNFGRVLAKIEKFNKFRDVTELLD